MINPYALFSRKNKYKKKDNFSDEWDKIKDESYDFDSIEYYFKKKEHKSLLQAINSKTINDIDLHELFMFIDRTNSKVGQQYLLNRLFTINTPLSFDSQERLIKYFNENEGARRKVRKILSKLHKHEAYYISDLFLTEYVQKPKWFWAIPVMSVLSITAFVATFFIPKMLLFLILFLIMNFIFHYWNKLNIYAYIDSIPQLLILCKIARELTKAGIPDTSVNSKNILSSVKSINSLKSDLSVFNLEAMNNGNDFVAIVLYIVELFKILFLIEPQIVFSALKKLEKKRSDIQTLFEYVGEIDATISIASLRATTPCWCQPVFYNKSKCLIVKDIYHPLIINAVSNTLDVGDKSILLTGSNMSGKTTFIRTIAVNTLLAQTINMAFATTFELSPMRLFSAIRISDDLLNDKSYYMEEVEIIKTMIDESQSKNRNIFFLDEIFKGTNTIERIAAGKAVLSYLSAGDNIVFVSTHDIELAPLLSDSYSLYHFTEIVDNNTIHFDYKLKPGKFSTKNAIRILEISNYPAQIIDEARKISGSH